MTNQRKLLFTAILLVAYGSTPGLARAASEFLIDFSLTTKMPSYPSGNSTCQYVERIRIVGDKILESGVGSKCRFAGGRTGGAGEDNHNGNIYKLNQSYSQTTKCVWKQGSEYQVCDNGRKIKLGKNTGSTSTSVTRDTYTSRLSGTQLTLSAQTVLGGEKSEWRYSFDTKDCSNFKASYSSQSKFARYSARANACKVVK